MFFVDATSGRDTNDGRTAETAFKTLNRAASAVKPGWTVRVMSGTYTSDGTANPMTLSTSGTPDAWIKFVAAEGQHPVVQIPRGIGAWAGIHLLGVAYVVIDGLEVVGLNGSITQSEASANDGSQAFLNHNGIFIDGVGFGDVHPPVPHDIVIRNASVHDCAGAGIEVNVGDAITIEHNRIYNNAWWTVFGTSGIGMYHLTDAPGSGANKGYKNFIVGNRSYGNRNNMMFLAGDPPAIYDGNGIIIDDSNHMQPALGTNDKRGVPYTGRTYVANNIVHDNGGRGIHVYSSQHVDIVNNTTWNNLLSTSDYIQSGEIDALRSSDVKVVNNVATNLVGKDVTIADDNQYEYNLWDGHRVPYRGSNDLVTGAQLTDPANGNFAPRAGSPALRSGTGALAPPDDFFGSPRPAGAVDRGAVQVSH
ncbi:MAG: right-handed parallel beta-helix repeat-containing protein [Myxococcales bacterium]